jgi:hypothetical protein
MDAREKINTREQDEKAKKIQNRGKEVKEGSQK